MTNAPTPRTRANNASNAAITPAIPGAACWSDQESSLHLGHDQALHRLPVR
jgi:hypothetical protein